MVNVRLRAAAPFLVFLAVMSGFAGTSAAADKTTCSFAFEVVAGGTHGTIGTGDTLQGKLDFTILGANLKGDTKHYQAVGRLTVSAAGHGTLSGDVWYVQVRRAEHLADYISVGIRGEVGNLGNETRYVSPTLVTVYGKRGHLTSFDLPKRPDVWNALQSKRVFQFHSPNAVEGAFYDIGPFVGGCAP